MDAFQLLVIILAAALGVLIIISVICIALLIKLLKQIRRITDKADHVIDNVQSVGDIFKKTAAPLAIGRAVTGFLSSVKGRKESKKRR